MLFSCLRHIFIPYFFIKRPSSLTQQAFKITFPGDYITVVYTWDYIQYNLWDTRFLYINVVEVGRYLTLIHAQYFTDKSNAGRKANRPVRSEMTFS